MEKRSGLLRGVPPAWQGLVHLVRTERHAKFHLVATLGVIVLGFAGNVSSGEWLWLFAAMAGVWITELVNSAIERLADRITRETDPLIGQAKDLAAGAVLVAAIFAALVGCIILL